MYTKFNKLSEEKKNIIIKSAIYEFSQNGYHKASTDKIASNANIAKGSLFNYFNSKKNLYIYIFKYCMEFISTRVRDEYENIESRDFFERLKIISLYKQKLFMEHPNEVRIAIDALKNEDNEIKNELNELMVKYSEDNMNLLQEYVIKYINKEELKENIDISDAIFMTTTVFEALSKRYVPLVQTSQIEVEDIITAKIFKEFDKYISILKDALYK